VNPEQRREKRRLQLLDAGLELFGSRGYANTSIRDVCHEAGLNRRYFYESFETREHLFTAVYDDLISRLVGDVVAAIEPHEDLPDKIDAGLRAFWAHVTSDARRARIFTIEVVGVSETLERRRREVRRTFADMFTALALAYGGEHGLTPMIDMTLVNRGLVAATFDLVIDWMRDDVDLSPSQLADHSIAYYTMIARAGFVAADEFDLGGSEHRPSAVRVLRT
jgi:AcrR family transcriptional regulator